MPSRSVTVSAGNPNQASGFVQRLRGFGAVGWLSILVVIAADVVAKPLSAVAAMVWARTSRTPLGALGYSRPANWSRAIVGGLIIGVALKVVLKALVMPLLGAPAVNPTYAFLEGNTAALPRMLYLIVVGAAFGEETLFRGFLFERVRTAFQTRTWAPRAALVLTSVIFGLAHYPDQGIPGVQQSLITGLVFGLLLMRSRSIVMPIVAHAAFDLTAVAMIYWGVEATVARAIYG